MWGVTKDSILEGELSSDYEGLEPDRRGKLRSCCHCGCTWAVNPDKFVDEHLPGAPDIERGRGYCSRCAGFVCGQPACRIKGCVPIEEMLFQLEAGIPWNLVHEDNRRIIVATS